MRVSLNWLRELTGLDAAPDEVASRLTFSGLEVEELTSLGQGFDRVVVGQVVSRLRHPRRDGLSVVEVEAGGERLTVVCGAPNCPDAGGLVAFARPGAVVGGHRIEERELAGVVSRGMICSEAELGIGPDKDGVLLLAGETDAAPGTPLADALGLVDTILGLNVTPNRPDALSHRGVARDLALLFGAPFSPPEPGSIASSEPTVAELCAVTIEAPDGCPRYGAAALLDVTVRPSPFRMRYRLHSLGVRPISNLVDVTNLVLLEWGQPLHAFDLDRITDRRIVVRRAREAERMRTLDGLERALTTDDLLICDGGGPVAIAGVMGGAESGIHDATRNVLFECAYFTPSGIRRTSKRLGLASESSYRFERGVDPEATRPVLAATVALGAGLAGGRPAGGIIDVVGQSLPRRRIEYRPSRYPQVVGSDPGHDEMRRIFNGLGVNVIDHAGAIWQVEVPGYRPDLEREIDLVEEVARIRGLGEVPTRLPRVQCRRPERPAWEASRRTRELMLALGLDESVTYSFVPEGLLTGLGQGQDLVHIANPLSSERAALRTTLIAGLVENLERATNRFLSGIRQFEIGRTFHASEGELPREVLRVAALLSGERDLPLGMPPSRFDFSDIRGLLDRFVERTTGRTAELFAERDLPGLHPARSCRVVVAGRGVGWVGELHPAFLAERKLSRGVLAFELDLMELWAQRIRPRVGSLPEHPPVTRDVAFLVEESVDVGPVSEALAEAVRPLGIEVRLFDVYRGAELPPGKKSLAFTVRYQAADRTLTDDEVDTVHREAVSKLEERFGARQR